MNTEDENLSIIQASTQLLVQALGRAQKLHKDKQAMDKLETENRLLAKIIKEHEAIWIKEHTSLQTDLSFLRSEVQEQQENLKHFFDSIDKLEEEKKVMKARLDEVEVEKTTWDADKQALEDENFQKGFDFYLLGFIANDPDYDWSKFGPGCAEDVKEFKVKNADKIKDKRVELGLEDAPQPKDASLEDQHISTQSTSPLPDPDQTIANPDVNSITIPAILLNTMPP